MEPFRFHVDCFHCRGDVLIHVGSAKLCTENGASFYMCSAVEIAWLAQNYRYSKYTCTVASAVAFRCL